MRGLTELRRRDADAVERAIKKRADILTAERERIIEDVIRRVLETLGHIKTEHER